MGCFNVSSLLFIATIVRNTRQQSNLFPIRWNPTWNICFQTGQNSRSYCAPTSCAILSGQLRLYRHSSVQWPPRRDGSITPASPWNANCPCLYVKEPTMVEISPSDLKTGSEVRHISQTITQFRPKCVICLPSTLPVLSTDYRQTGTLALATYCLK